MPPDRHDPAGNPLPRRLHWKHGAYFYVFRAAGRLRWTRLSDSYPEALREWARLEGAGQHAKTIAQACEAFFIERGPELAERTLHCYRNSEKRILEWAGTVRLEELDRPDVRKFLHARSAAVSANRDVAFLRSVYSFAIENGWCAENPCAGVRRLTERPRRREATPQEVERLLAKASPMWQAIIRTALAAAARETELRLIPRAAKREEGLRIVRTKTRTESTVEWSDELRGAIELALASHPKDKSGLMMFVNRSGRPYTLHGWTSNWTRLCKRAGVVGLQFRDLRRTALTAAESLEHARDLAGHGTSAITRRVYRIRDKVKPAR